MKQETLGGKGLDHWEIVIAGLKSVIGALDGVAKSADEKGQTAVASMAREDINAVMEALVLVDYEVTQRFGEKKEGVVQ